MEVLPIQPRDSLVELSTLSGPLTGYNLSREMRLAAILSLMVCAAAPTAGHAAQTHALFRPPNMSDRHCPFFLGATPLYLVKSLSHCSLLRWGKLHLVPVLVSLEHTPVCLNDVQHRGYLIPLAPSVNGGVSLFFPPPFFLSLLGDRDGLPIVA